MGRIISFIGLIGGIKDILSVSKATLVSSPGTISLHLAILRATTHSSSTPLDHRHLAGLFSVGDGSRATASVIISALIDRLHHTGNSTVALKCLLIIHHIIKTGAFILQDQFAVIPATGGHNYLKLSSFRHGATASTWVLSAWVRWYARYIETLILSSRVLGYLLCSCSCSMQKDKHEEIISSYSNKDLINGVDSLIGVMEEMCEAPDPGFLEGNEMLNEVVSLLSNDYLSTVNEMLSRLNELNHRLCFLNSDEIVELKRALKRLENCKEKLSMLFKIKKPSMEDLWFLIDELNGNFSELKVGRERKMMLTWGGKDELTRS